MERDPLWNLFMNTGLPEADLLAKGEERRHRWLERRVQEVRSTFEPPAPPEGLS